MSFVRARRLTDKVTVWRKAGYNPNDPYSATTTRVGVFACNWIEGGSNQRDAEGVDFTPSKTIRLQNADVKLNDFVYIGDVTDATPPSDAEIVRGRKGGGTMLAGGLDLTVYTG
jgi:hypothetical protein